MTYFPFQKLFETKVSLFLKAPPHRGTHDQVHTIAKSLWRSKVIPDNKACIVWYRALNFFYFLSYFTLFLCCKICVKFNLSSFVYLTLGKCSKFMNV